MFLFFFFFYYFPLNSISICCNIADSYAAAAKSLQSCQTLCDPIDSSPPGSPIPGIHQARTLEWIAISFSNACFISICLSQYLLFNSHMFNKYKLNRKRNEQESRRMNESTKHLFLILPSRI